MDSTWFEVLVIILSSLLAIFLLLAITLAILLIKVVRQIRRITEHAEQVVDKAEDIAEFFRNTTGPVAVIKLLSNIGEAVQRKSRKFKRGK